MVAENREHRRVKQIKKLMIDIKGAELVTDELKKLIMERDLFDKEQVFKCTSMRYFIY